MHLPYILPLIHTSEHALCTRGPYRNRKTTKMSHIEITRHVLAVNPSHSKSLNRILRFTYAILDLLTRYPHLKWKVFTRIRRVNATNPSRHTGISTKRYGSWVNTMSISRSIWRTLWTFSMPGTYQTSIASNSSISR